ncbi:hypothetical protein P5W98_04315 [Paraburkholderia sp. A1BS-2L]|uniref:hypothetical protein n=1 Tax=unclassified Paraburkholderia TaxID=2615204 RepID=UPI003DA8E56D
MKSVVRDFAGRYRINAERTANIMREFVHGQKASRTIGWEIAWVFLALRFADRANARFERPRFRKNGVAPGMHWMFVSHAVVFGSGAPDFSAY